MKSDNITFYAYMNMNKDNSTTLTPPGLQGVSREAKFSVEFQFGSLVH